MKKTLNTIITVVRNDHAGPDLTVGFASVECPTAEHLIIDDSFSFIKELQ